MTFLQRFAVFVFVGGAVAWACGGATDDRPADWSYIAPIIIAPNCATASCHSKGAAVAGLDLSTPDSAYQGLFKLSAQKDPTCKVTKTDPCTIARPLVTPCSPTQSRVVNMLRARNAVRMPPDRPLPEADVALIERWILDGAKQHAGDDDVCAVPASGLGGTSGGAGMSGGGGGSGGMAGAGGMM